MSLRSKGDKEMIWLWIFDQIIIYTYLVKRLKPNKTLANKSVVLYLVLFYPSPGIKGGYGTQIASTKAPG